jgi:DnaJ family protein C protein 25
MWHKFLLVFCALHHLSSAHLLSGIYCGEENCYDILNVTRDSTKGEISKNYRALARLYHPDAKTGSDELFKRVRHEA